MTADLPAQWTADPWAIQPAALQGLFAAMGAFTEDGLVKPAPRRSRLYVRKNGLAEIPIKGILLKTVPSVLRSLGIEATAYSEIRRDLRDALSDKRVKEVVLFVDSPGGQIGGLKEVADTIFDARRKLPVKAVVDDLGVSAAYWLASQAKKVVVGANAQVGGIGVFSVVTDSSRVAEKRGLKVHLISSGVHKGAGIEGVPVSPEQLESLRAVVDGMAENFLKDVARGRSLAIANVRPWGSGQIWIAGKARSLGLADRVKGGGNSTDGGGPLEPMSKSVGEIPCRHCKKAGSVTLTQDGSTARFRCGACHGSWSGDPPFTARCTGCGVSVPTVTPSEWDQCEGCKAKSIAALRPQKEETEMERTMTQRCPMCHGSSGELVEAMDRGRERWKCSGAKCGRVFVVFGPEVKTRAQASGESMTAEAQKMAPARPIGTGLTGRSR